MSLSSLMSLSDARTELELALPLCKYSWRVLIRTFSSTALFSSVIPVSAPMSSTLETEGGRVGYHGNILWRIGYHSNNLRKMGYHGNILRRLGYYRNIVIYKNPKPANDPNIQ